MSHHEGDGVYAESFRRDRVEVAATLKEATKKIDARLRNAADMAERRHVAQRNLVLLLAEVEHVLGKGTLGKQSKRRLKAAVKKCKESP